ncbi:MAG: serine/threonine-protein kinase, partial [Planctomycetota bacterium]
MSPVDDRLKRGLEGSYAVLRELGRGATSTVYLAEDLKHHRQVAIKVLHPEIAAMLGTDRFRREIEISAHLEHPHILTLIDSGEADGLLYYVMPLVEGESLDDRLERDNRIPVDEAVRIVREVADGLAYAHQRNVIHRDVKPANILLAESHALIADFGIAKALTDTRSGKVTQTGVTVGSPAYMSPEQVAGAEGLDGRTDIYSLGCVLYEMLAGATPSKGNTLAAIFAHRMIEEPPPLSSLV